MCTSTNFTASPNPKIRAHLCNFTDNKQPTGSDRSASLIRPGWASFRFVIKSWPVCPCVSSGLAVIKTCDTLVNRHKQTDATRTASVWQAQQKWLKVKCDIPLMSLCIMLFSCKYESPSSTCAVYRPANFSVSGPYALIWSSIEP